MSTMNFTGPGFQLQVPTDWFITSSAHFQAMFIAPKIGEGLRSNLMITMRQVEDGVTVENVAKLARETQVKEYSQFEIVDEGKMKVSGVGAFQRLYRWFNKDANALVLQRQVMVVHSQVLITLTATRPVDEANKVYDVNFATMIDSFQFTQL